MLCYLFCTVSRITFSLISGVTSLRDVMLLVQPSTVIRGGTAALICSRDMQGAPLYSVKWYRGNHEFYRYTPMEDPDTRVFGLPGIYVDVSREFLSCIPQCTVDAAAERMTGTLCVVDLIPVRKIYVYGQQVDVLGLAVCMCEFKCLYTHPSYRKKS